MKTLKINAWMEMEMLGYLFFAVYVVSETEWWILGKGDSYEEAKAILDNEMADADESDEGEWMVVDFDGQKVEG